MSPLLYRPGTSWLHRIHPLTKLCFLLWSMTAAFSLPWQIAIPASLALIVVGALSGIGRSLLRLWSATVAPLVVALVILHGWLLHAPDMTVWGALRWSRVGLEAAARTSGRISLLLASSLLMLVTTHPSQMVKALDAEGVSPGLSYLIASPLLLVESFAEKAHAIRDAQRARGLAIEGPLWKHPTTLVAVLVPLVVFGLDDAHRRSAALTGRAFRALSRRTVLGCPSDSRHGPLVRWLLLAAAVLQGGLALWH